MLNIVYIHTHDTGRCIGPYGYPVDTPNLQNLAEHSVVFRNAHSAAPTCSPSRAALLTGTYPHENGMLGLAHRGFVLRDYRMHIVSHLKAAGYTTALCGVQHVAPRKNMIGYDRILDNRDEYYDGGIDNLSDYDLQNARHAAEYIEKRAARGPRTDGEAADEPFFLSFGMLNTHRPFPSAPDTQSGRDSRADWVRSPHPLLDTPEQREDTAAFHRAVETVDQCTGIVMQALERTGLDRDTLVLFTTDHGPAFPDMKATLKDSGTGVALMLRLPGFNPQVIDAMVSQLDVYPTICEVIGTTPPHTLRGSSLLPLTRGEKGELRSHLFTETSFHAAYEPARAVRTGRYKLIRRYSPAAHRLAVNVDDSPGKDFLARHGYFSTEIGNEELYDLALDPTESCNRSSTPEYQEVKAELEAQLRCWMESTGDPLLKGWIQAPPEALLNKPDAFSPESGEFE
ncbi:MAG: sulfatase [Spirochaetota bacterium]